MAFGALRSQYLRHYILRWIFDQWCDTPDIGLISIGLRPHPGFHVVNINWLQVVNSTNARASGILAIPFLPLVFDAFVASLERIFTNPMVFCCGPIATISNLYLFRVASATLGNNCYRPCIFRWASLEGPFVWRLICGSFLGSGLGWPMNTRWPTLKIA